MTPQVTREAHDRIHIEGVKTVSPDDSTPLRGAGYAKGTKSDDTRG